MDTESLRPGFNLDVTFKGHLSNVRLVARNPLTGRFYSVRLFEQLPCCHEFTLISIILNIQCDDKALKTWSSKEGNVVVHHSTSFPGYQSTFITAMCVAADTNLLFAACLDGNLRIYNERLTLKSAMPWGEL